MDKADFIALEIAMIYSDSNLHSGWLLFNADMQLKGRPGVIEVILADGEKFRITVQEVED